jgi:tetratricopeptide (TPR) repeat protein
MKKQNCSYHPRSSAWGICSRCGRDLCYDCFLHYERKGFCPQCKHRFPSTILKLKSYLLNPVSVLILTIGLSSLLYLTVEGEKTSLTGQHSSRTHLDRKDIALRNWLYLGKAVRLRLYADHLKETNQAGLAKHSYYRSRLALQQVLQGTQREHPAAAMDTKAADESIREYMGELFISIAVCYRGEQQTQTAIRTLHRAIEIIPASDRTSVAGLAYYNLGQIYEEDIKDYEKAISMYKAAQENASKRIDFMENMLTFLEKPVSDKRIATSSSE